MKLSNPALIATAIGVFVATLLALFLLRPTDEGAAHTAGSGAGPSDRREGAAYAMPPTPATSSQSAAEHGPAASASAPLPPELDRSSPTFSPNALPQNDPPKPD